MRPNINKLANVILPIVGCHATPVTMSKDRGWALPQLVGRLRSLSPMPFRVSHNRDEQPEVPQLQIIFRSARTCVLAMCAVLTFVQSFAVAANLPLTGTAEGETRWFEMFSDAFAQLDQGEPETGNPTNTVHRLYPVLGGNPTPQELLDFDPTTFDPTSFIPLGSQIEVFPLDEFFDLGQLSYNDAGMTGTGYETFPISGYTVDFAQNIADDDDILGVGYSTAVDSVGGTVSFFNGTLASIDLTSSITFTYDFSSQGGGLLDYSGTFTIEENKFDLFVDGYYATAQSPLRYIWDSTGIVDQVFPISADSDGNDNIDGFDFLAWQIGFGLTGPELGPADGNFDSNTVIDSNDLAVWEFQFGTSPGGFSAFIAVPEPATAWLMVVLAVGFTSSRVFRRAHRFS